MTLFEKEKKEDEVKKKLVDIIDSSEYTIISNNDSIGLMIYSDNENCLIRTKLEKCSENHYIPCRWTGNCDAYSPVFPLNIIKSENEMIEFIEKTENFFGCPEEYENYFGFERKWDEGSGDILETTREYYDRGGKFTNIPNQYPCVIYFGVVDFDGGRMRDEKLDWIYIE